MEQAVSEKSQKRFWFDVTKPLWLPDGSIRALLILMLAGTMAGILLKFAAYQQEIPKSVETIMTQLLPALVLLISKYIDLRTGNGDKPTV